MLKLKFIAGMVFMLVSLGAAAQDDSKTKVKPVHTLGDKVHNVIHPRHKRHSGMKWKHKHGDVKTTTKTEGGETTTKTKKE